MRRMKMARKSDNTALNQLCDFQNLGLPANRETVSVTFVAGTTGSVGKHTLATVTGVVAVSIIGLCTVDVTGTGSAQIGTTAVTNAIVASTTGTTIDANELWFDATPISYVAVGSVPKIIVGDNISYEVTGDTLTGGVVKFYILWSPLSPDGNLTV
jgi:hypothetical protein